MQRNDKIVRRRNQILIYRTKARTHINKHIVYAVFICGFIEQKPNCTWHVTQSQQGTAQLLRYT